MMFCDYCNDICHRGDLYILRNRKKECWRCRFYFKDEYGNWQMKRRFNEPEKFMDDGNGHYVLNPEYKKEKK